MKNRWSVSPGNFPETICMSATDTNVFANAFDADENVNRQGFKRLILNLNNVMPTARKKEKS